MVDNISIQQTEEPISYELGWLLHNPQVNDERLCSYLLSETSVEIARLVFRFLKLPSDRIAALDQIFLNVLLRRHLFKNNISGKAGCTS